MRFQRLALGPAMLMCAGIVAGCGSSAPVPKVTGSFGADPVVAIPSSQPASQLMVQTVIKGHGPVVRPGDYVITNVQGTVWAGARMIINTYTKRQPQGIPLSSGMPAWRHLAGQQVGSRVVMVVPPKDGFGPRGNAQLNVMGGDTLVLVFDILRALPDRAGVGGPASYRPGPGLPVVTSRRDAPVITVPKTAPPRHLVVKVIRRGGGPPILAGQTIAAQYTGVVWRTGKVFDSSWDRGFPQSFVLGSDHMIPGWDQGLGGLPAGSRVLLVVPPALAYGRSAEPPYIKSWDTLVFVVDILAAVKG